MHNAFVTMTTFLVKQTFKFTARPSVVFLGDILEGTVQPGQTIRLPSAK